MKYQPAAILLVTSAASSLMMESDGLDTLSKHTSNQRQLMPMYGYCIGCVALVTTTTHNIDNTEFTTTAITPSSSSSTVENGVLSGNSSGSALEHAAISSCSETRLFLPTAKKNTTTSEQHFFQPSSSTAINLHQLNLILLSRSIHNNNRGFGEQQPFLSDICALSLFLVAVAIGIAWGGSSSSSSTNDKKKKTDEQHHDDTNNEHEFDLISRRLVYDEFFDIGIGLVPTIDDDEEEKNVQEQEQQEKVEKEATKDTSVLSPLVGDIIKPQRTLTLPSHDHEQQEWKKPPLFHPTVDDEDETSTVTTQEEALIAGYRKYLPKSRKKNTKVVKKSILTIRSPSHTECVSTATPKVTTTKRVSFHKDVRVKVIAPDDDEEASISSSSSSSTTTKKRKGLFKLHKLSLGNLCEMKSREYVPLRE